MTQTFCVSWDLVTKWTHYVKKLKLCLPTRDKKFVLICFTSIWVISVNKSCILLQTGWAGNLSFFVKLASFVTQPEVKALTRWLWIAGNITQSQPIHSEDWELTKITFNIIIPPPIDWKKKTCFVNNKEKNQHLKTKKKNTEVPPSVVMLQKALKELPLPCGSTQYSSVLVESPLWIIIWQEFSNKKNKHFFLG